MVRTDASCLADHASRGPRYTSYPPATEFGPIGIDQVRRELAILGERRDPISLHVIATRDTRRGVDDLAPLIAEMDQVARGVRTAPVTELVLGGGSPSFLQPDALRALIDALEQRFAIAPGARRSIELDPRTTTSAQIDVLAARRFRSLSIGVQDFSEAVQDAGHRHQSVLQTRWLVDRARTAGFDDIHIDIVYGLPRQTEASFARTLDEVIGLAPDRIALSGYAHLPSKLPHQRLVERAGLERHERAALLLMGIDRLTDAGYLHLGLDHFARPGSRLARAAGDHRADAIVGLGVSAISSTPRMFWQSHAELSAWQQEVEAGAPPVARGLVLDDDDRVRRAVIGELMCTGEVDLGAIAADHGLDAETYFATELAALDDLYELASYDEATRTVRTTLLGQLVVRNVCVVFDRYLRVPVAEPRAAAGASRGARFQTTL